MEWTDVNCPRCNSLQQFKPRTRTTDGKKCLYIKCSMCKWESELDPRTDVNIAAKRRRRKNVSNNRTETKKQK